MKNETKDGQQIKKKGGGDLKTLNLNTNKTIEIFFV